MPSAWSIGTAVALAASLAAASPAAPPSSDVATQRFARQPIDWKLKQRSSVTNANALAGQTFDYVIVGCVTKFLHAVPASAEDASCTRLHLAQS